jgi:hypothetical protein
MNFKNHHLLLTISVVALALFGLSACQPRDSKNSSANGPFQCIAATITIAGKPTTTVVEWNAVTGAARLLDSMVVTSKATGAQNIVVGWISLGDLQSTINEIVNRNQAQQPAPQKTLPAGAADNKRAASSTKAK